SDSVEVFTALMRSIERSQAELLEVMEEKQKAAERRAEEFIKDLEQEITELKRRDTELDGLIYYLIFMSHTVFLLVNVILDPDTAYPKLILSDDGKRVSCGAIKQNLPDSQKRFTNYSIILGKEGFSSGRFYYEVQVRGKTEWKLGVARESIERKGETTLCPRDGFWTVGLSNGNEYYAAANYSASLSLRENLQKLGVFVDYEEGLVCFYDVEARSHIYFFTDQVFTEKLYPYFNPMPNDGGKNSAPLIISPVSNTE
uniref:B30.2/SPRY domain-containing protein n=1 Tax=Astyanax mexicanus TaxID=7994 RepID=A0A8B9HCP6_ASTMX